MSRPGQAEMLSPTMAEESDRILAIDRWMFRGRDGIEVEEELPTAYTFRAGLVVRVEGFTDRTEAFEAVGLAGPNSPP